MRALVVGGDSRIAGYLRDELLVSHEVVATSRRGAPDVWFDLERPCELPTADVAYLCAGVTKFLECAQNEDRARLINVTNTLKAVASLVERGARVVYLSSSAADTLQDSAYGRLKLEAERGLLAHGDHVAIYRFGPVAFPGRNCYPDGPYQPVKPELLVRELACAMTRWRPGIHRLHVLDEAKAA